MKTHFGSAFPDIKVSSYTHTHTHTHSHRKTHLLILSTPTQIHLVEQSDLVLPKPFSHSQCTFSLSHTHTQTRSGTHTHTHTHTRTHMHTHAHAQVHTHTHTHTRTHTCSCTGTHTSVCLSLSSVECRGSQQARSLSGPVKWLAQHGTLLPRWFKYSRTTYTVICIYLYISFDERQISQRPQQLMITEKFKWGFFRTPGLCWQVWRPVGTQKYVAGWAYVHKIVLIVHRSITFTG